MVRPAVVPGSLRRPAAAPLCLWAALLLTAALRPATAAGNPAPPYGLLADSVGFLESGGASRAHFGILAVSLDRGDTLLASEPDHRFIPASNMKLFTTGAFLRRFGPDARGVTRLTARGETHWKQGHTRVDLKGVLTLIGCGYPDVVQLLHPGSRGLLDSLACLLRDSGLAKFEGKLLVDGTLFAREPFGPGWAIDDLPFSYGAAVNAILANGNAATLVATATKGGVQLALDPPETPLRVAGHVTLGDSSAAPRLSVSREAGSSLLRVSGVVPRGGSAKRQVAVPDPDSTAGLVLLGAMRRAGIEVRATVEIVAQSAAPDSAPPVLGWARVDRKETSTVVVLETPSAAEVVAMVSAYSLNVETEGLLRLLDPSPVGKTAAQGLRHMAALLTDAGVDTLDLSLVDGSGLSPLNLATARSFVRWLTALGRDPALGTLYHQTLAAPGNVGTLQKRFAALDDGADLRAKTGTLTNVSALSGYLSTADGERVVFSILSNGNRGGVAAAHEVEERTVSLLSRFRRPPPEAARPIVGIPR